MTFHDSPKQISRREELEEGIGVLFPSHILWEPPSAEFILQPKGMGASYTVYTDQSSRHGGRERWRVDGVREQRLEANKIYCPPNYIINIYIIYLYFIYNVYTKLCIKMYILYKIYIVYKCIDFLYI